MNLPGLGAARGAVRRLRNAFRPSAVVLLYHRVAELESDPQLLAVTPRRFEEHVALLRRHFRPARLAALAEALRTGEAPPRAVVVTFDDGYADNLHSARPALDRHDVPATVFVATGLLGQPGEFWWDEVEQILLSRPSLPSLLTLRLDGVERSWELGADAVLGPSEVAARRSWNVLTDRATPRQRAYRELSAAVRRLTPALREEALGQLRAWAGEPAQARPSHRALTPEETRALAAGGLVEVAAHTVTHPVLAALPPSAQRRELAESKARLEEILGAPVRGFSYPFGTRRDYTAATAALARQCGFSYACSNFPGAVRRGADLFELPRFLVRDWDADELSRRLSAWFRE